MNLLACIPTHSAIVWKKRKVQWQGEWLERETSNRFIDNFTGTRDFKPIYRINVYLKDKQA